MIRHIKCERVDNPKYLNSLEELIKRAQRQLAYCSGMAKDILSVDDGMTPSTTAIFKRNFAMSKLNGTVMPSLLAVIYIHSDTSNDTRGRTVLA